MSNFNINIVEVPAMHLVGIRTRTTIPRSSIDCPPIWEKFISQMKKLPGGTKSPSYNVFLMVDRRISFDYWAAAEVPFDFEPPEGMEAFDLPAKKYACCHVLNSAETLLAYSAVYSDWVQEQDEYDVDMMGPCFERYPPMWKPGGDFDLFAAVRPKDDI